ncbi:hypothetical protein CKALI_03720 [Corynebacterium kalinowskii]|uniref:SF3 helicase domain-containing protein n=1 Tax=Corynebacterium kalinowskii TaxID=2675216 RepID=A0A6B8VRI4_9CORY|nr:bifunctional DNA primase/polymerase [Corynebacterium kalinowskii]QGU01625.1 hypothetical protein CKALI_03720 [Corynebacterium kalinowskii]
MSSTLAQNETDVTTHLKNGLALFPLPAGRKYPPVKNATGNIPDLTLEQIKEFWEDAPAGSNTGVRVQQIPETEQEILILDIDQYDGKQGYESFKRVCGELKLDADQVLNSTIRVSRRDSDNPSGHYYFTVTAGQKFQRSCGADVDVIQKGHRYGIAPGSVVDGKEYKCYKGTSDEETTFSLDKAQALPSALFDYLVAGIASDPELQSGESYGTSKAMQWLTASAPEFDGDLGDIFTSELTGDEPKKFSSEIWESNNSHDAMVAVTRWAIRLAVFEGESGLNKALEILRSEFFNRPKSHNATEGEFQRAITGEVNKVRSEIEKGRKTYLEKTALLKGLDASTLSGAEVVYVASETSIAAVGDIVQFTRGMDLQAAQLLALTKPELVIRIIRKPDGKKDEAIYDPVAGVVVGEGDLVNLYNDVVPELVGKWAATLPVPDIDDEDAAKYYEAAMKKAHMLQSYMGNATNITRLAKMALAAIPRKMDFSEFNAEPGVRALRGNTHVLEMADGVFRVRRRTSKDFLTNQLGFSFEQLTEGVKQLNQGVESDFDHLIEVVIPNPEYRQWLQMAMGYALYKDNPKRVLLVWWGAKGRGKGTLANAFLNWLGDYGATGSLEAISSREVTNTEKVQVIRSTIGFISELSSRTVGDASALKEIAGNDPVTSADKYMQAETHHGTTLVMQTNHAPTITGADEALRDRLLVIPFEADDVDVAHEMQKISRRWHGQSWMVQPVNIAAMLRWLRKGYLDSQKVQFRESEYPRGIVSKIDEFMATSNPLRSALTEEYVFTSNRDDVVPTTLVRDALRTLNQDLKGISLSEIEEAVKDLGGGKRRPIIEGKKVSAYWGLRSREADEQIYDEMFPGFTRAEWKKYLDEVALTEADFEYLSGADI